MLTTHDRQGIAEGLGFAEIMCNVTAGGCSPLQKIQVNFTSTVTPSPWPENMQDAQMPYMQAITCLGHRTKRWKGFVLSSWFVSLQIAMLTSKPK